MARTAKYLSFLALLLWIISTIMVSFAADSPIILLASIMIVLVPTLSLIAVILGILGRKDNANINSANIGIGLGLIMMILGTLILGYLTSTPINVNGPVPIVSER